MEQSNEKAKPIGVFDSGIGGLTVVKALMKQLPHENIVYFGDTARVPYGNKSAETVREYTAHDTEVLLKNNVKMIVIACNTVSSVALDIVQKKAKLPVIGVIVPGAYAAAITTKNNRIGVIGTVGTIASNAYVNAIRLTNKKAEVVSQACPLFVPLAEEGWIDHKATEIIAKEYLFPLKLARIDTLVLGCTHYPILASVIEKVFDNNIMLVDSGEATALEVKKLLEEKNLKNQSKQKAHLQFFVSDIPHKFTEIGERFLGQKLGRVRRITDF